VNGDSHRFYDEFIVEEIPKNIDVKFNETKIQNVLSETDLLVSLTDRAGWIETFGLTLAEAMSFGIPVIAPNIGAQTEYVIHGENGFLVDESDLESIRGFIDVLFFRPQ
jgi:glycosyltransferase involved in cell wall biosynthesis